MRTWILVALRAATEPVKEEAMQAIFVVGFFVVKKGKCAGMAPPHRATLVLSASKLRGELVRGTRPIVARKKIAIGVSIGALDFMSRGVEKFPPSSYGELVTKIASLDIQRESQTRDDRSDDRFWLERKGKAVKFYGISLARFPGDAQRGHFHNRDRIFISGGGAARFS